ncbi:MAG: threonyl-tRNA synthetase editing domain-containing protein [Ktedonobacterales bacterium]
MRLLMWHVDGFTAEPTTRGRSPVADDEPQTVTIGEGLVVFVAAEAVDEEDTTGVEQRAVAAIMQTARQLGTQTVALHSFAHLFVERLATPAVARELLVGMEARLKEQGLTVSQSAFGWFNRLDLRAKGHAYSRMARRV